MFILSRLLIRHRVINSSHCPLGVMIDHSYTNVYIISYFTLIAWLIFPSLHIYCISYIISIIINVYTTKSSYLLFSIFFLVVDVQNITVLPSDLSRHHVMSEIYLILIT